MMRVRRLSALCLASVLLCAACVTINIYFPAKEAKEGVQSLEEELLKPKPQSLREPAERSASRDSRAWSLTATAWAQSDLSQRIKDELKGVPEVVEAYSRMRQRLPEVDRLRSHGFVGEGKDGKLALRVSRATVPPTDIPLIDRENQDRDIVITEIAKAIIRINRLEASASNVSRAKPQAGELFADIRRESAEPGWWIQFPDGAWRKK